MSHRGPPTTARHDVHALLEDGSTQPVAELVLATDQRGRHRHSGLRYLDDWLAPGGRGFDLDPVHAPRTRRETEWITDGEIPAVIDEALPGAWERVLLARAWERRGTPGDTHDLHAVLHEPHATLRVGAVAIVPAGHETGALRSPLAVDDLEALAGDADRIGRHELPEVETLLRLQAGSSVGGARPKVLVSDNDRDCIAKFNRKQDSFNHARIEHACLHVAGRCGLRVPDSRVIRAGRHEALLIERFDTTATGGRRHMISANALLKDPSTCADRHQASYEDLIDLVRRYSDEVTDDLRQLYIQMLLNEAINNRDDHLRNFSFLRIDGAFRLSPAYDLVVAEELGAYPVLSFDHRPRLPRPGSREALEAARTFRLRPAEARNINNRFVDVFSRLDQVLGQAGVNESDLPLLHRVCWQPG